MPYYKYPPMWDWKFDHEVGNKTVLRVHLANKPQMESWVTEFGKLNGGTLWKNGKTYRHSELTTRYIAHKKWVCKPNRKPKKRNGRRPAACPASVDIKIKIFTPKTRRTDDYLKCVPPLQAVVTIAGVHNHKIEAPLPVEEPPTVEAPPPANIQCQTDVGPFVGVTEDTGPLPPNTVDRSSAGSHDAFDPTTTAQPETVGQRSEAPPVKGVIIGFGGGEPQTELIIKVCTDATMDPVSLAKDAIRDVANLSKQNSTAATESCLQVTTAYVYPCSACALAFGSIDYLRQHEKTCKKLKALTAEKRPSATDPGVQILSGCAECHRMQVAANRGEGGKCPRCVAAAAKANGIDPLPPSTAGPHICQVCYATYELRADLHDHQRMLKHKNSWPSKYFQLVRPH